MNDKKWDELLKKFLNLEIIWIECIPPSAELPQLQRFIDAPYKFNKGYTSNSKNHRCLVWYDLEAVIVYDTEDEEALAFVFTRTSKRIFGMPFPTSWLPKNLSAWKGFNFVPELLYDYEFIKRHFELPLSIRGEDIVQGHLVMRELWFRPTDEELLRWRVGWETDTIYNHRFTNAKVHQLPYDLWLVETYDEQPEVTSDDHEKIQLEPKRWYVAYHPPPQVAD